jgi:prolycopene isomerase
MKQTVPTQAEIVVIGAGMGGLTAAALLAKAGREVVVIEPEFRPGGYLAGFRRRKFIFDSAIHWLNQCGPDGFVYKVLDWIGDDFPVCEPLTRIRRYKGDSFDYLLTNRPDDLRDQFLQDLPGNTRGLNRMFRDAQKVGQCMSDYAHLMRATETMGLFEKMVRGLKMAFWGMPFARFYKKSAVEGLARYVPSGRLSEIFVSEEALLAVLVPLGWAYSHDFQAPPEGGSQAFPKWLVERIRGFGSEVVLRKRVDKILLDGDTAVGVRLESGEEIKARHVLAACDVDAVYNKMLPPGMVPPALLKKLDRADLYDSSVTLSVGLDCPTQSLGFGEEMIYLSRDGVTRHDLNNGDPHKSGLCILAPTIRDPTMAPEGKGTLTIYCPATLDYANHWHTETDLKRGKAYKAFKKEYAGILLDRVEESIAPGLQDHVEHLDIATPVTHWRYTGNKGGSIMGARPSKANIRSRVAHYKTPVKNLLLAGHWAEYGGGVPIAAKAGANAALLVLKKEDPKAFKHLVRIMDKPLHQA